MTTNTPNSSSDTDVPDTLPDSSELASLTEFACELADAASAIALRHFRQPINVDNKLSGNNFDPVTIADRDAEAVMRELIHAKHPTHGIYGEEHGAEPGSCNLTWVLDPIDGTRAFISGLPTWGILIALYNGTKPIVGVMDQPFTGERYFACGNNSASVLRHKGVDTPISTSQCDQLSNAIMMSTALDMFSSAELAVQQELVQLVKMMRYGGDCYSYCLLASGHIDLVVESDLSTYDIQALIPIVENAGGVISDWSGETAVYGGQVVAAATPELHRQAIEVLVSAAKKSDKIL